VDFPQCRLPSNNIALPAWRLRFAEAVRARGAADKSKQRG